jgi:probable rRNA maturation factor
MTELELELNLIDADLPGLSVDRERIDSLSKYVLQQTGATGEWEVAVVLTTDGHLRDIHRQFMGIDEVTDVMTFPADPSEDGTSLGGDIVISVDRAAAQGGAFGHSRDQEIEFLVVHGLLHLCGWDDHSSADRERMLNYQTELIAQFNAQS